MKTVNFVGSDKHLRVEKILCLGRNYAEYAKEMKAEIPEQPVAFLKPSTAIIHDGESVIIPSISHEMHHEVEMVVVIGKEGRHIPVSSAMDHVAGYGVGLDMTLRDIQSDAKKKGLPWTVAKGFDTSAPVSSIVERQRISDPHNLNISLKVNGTTRQHSNTRNMIFRVDRIISFLSGIFTLEAGDLIFTGTPEGVGIAVPGDVLEAELESVGIVRVGVRKEFTD
jgi:5-carboxymethyl-2-hydroxymuconate isomerase